MKKIVRESICLFLIALNLALPAQGQGMFQNLNFAAAQIPAGTTNGSFLPVSQLLPGWSAYIGSVQENTIGYNMVYPDVVGVTLFGPGNPGLAPGSSYTAVMQAGGNPANGYVSSSIVQTGLIPVTAMSLVFTASYQYGAGWAVTIEGQNISVRQEANFGAYGIYAGDISAFAGKIEQLQFSALGGHKKSKLISRSLRSLSLQTLFLSQQVARYF